MPQLRPIWRCVSPDSYFSLRTSLIFRMDSLSAGNFFLLVKREEATGRLSSAGPLADHSGNLPTHSDSTPKSGYLRVGTGGYLPSESVDTFVRNDWIPSIGISGGFAPEYAQTLENSRVPTRTGRYARRIGRKKHVDHSNEVVNQPL